MWRKFEEPRATSESEIGFQPRRKVTITMMTSEQTKKVHMTVNCSCIGMDAATVVNGLMVNWCSVVGYINNNNTVSSTTVMKVKKVKYHISRMEPQQPNDCTRYMQKSTTCTAGLSIIIVITWRVLQHQAHCFVHQHNFSMCGLTCVGGISIFNSHKRWLYRGVALSGCFCWTLNIQSRAK